MNLSRAEQRTLHALAQGGRILLERDEQGRILAARCFTREGWVLTGGEPYRVNRDGLARMRSQLDNRVSARRW
ncbi:MAG: hypothetical protein HYU61_05615 [Brevundimonas diminuta]|nr:hypothetical protein [Brevundimonas diminuta]